MAAVCLYIYHGYFGLCICLSIHNHYFAFQHMSLSGGGEIRLPVHISYVILLFQQSVQPFNFNNLKTECPYNSIRFRNYSIIMFNTSEKNIQFIFCNSYGIFINIPFTKSIIKSIHVEVLIHFIARMNSNRLILSINVKHATALMVIIVWRYNYPYSIILMLIAYYYYMYLFLLFASDTQCKLRCSILVSVTIYIVVY